MQSHHSPSIPLPTVENPQRTLVVAKRSGFCLLLLFLACALWRLGLNQVEARSLQQRNTASLTRSVIGVHARSGEASRKIVLPASLRGSTEAQIYARTNGYLSAWYKTIGDHVDKGELLAVIDVPELEQELAQAHAAIAQIKVRLELSRTTLKRWTLLKESDSVIQQEYDEKRSAVLQAEADLAAAEVNAKRLEKVESYRRIVAPFSGVITRRTLDVGNLITTGTQELFALTQTNRLRLTVWVPQVYAEYVKNGQEVAVRLIESHEKPLIAHVEHVAGALDPVTRSRQVDITLENRDNRFLPGSYVEVSINVIGAVNPIVAPVNVLVVNQAGTHVVTVNADNRIAFRPVMLGRDYGREIEIIEGVSPDDLLVASPSDLMVEGETVTVVQAQEKPKEKKTSKS